MHARVEGAYGRRQRALVSLGDATHTDGPERREEAHDESVAIGPAIHYTMQDVLVSLTEHYWQRERTVREVSERKARGVLELFRRRSWEGNDDREAEPANQSDFGHDISKEM